MGSSREEKKKFIGDLLKAADRYIKAAEYPEAMAEVNKALAAEPGNMYALAYNQRIKAAVEALRKKEEANRVKKISECKNGAAKSAEAANAAAAANVPAEQVAAADTARGASASSEDDLYTIRQQKAQIERFKTEMESMRVKHQQEISVLAGEIQEARAYEKEAKEKYRVVVDDTEESYRRSEELYAEVVRLNERVAQLTQAADEERHVLSTDRQKELLRHEGEREKQAAEHKREVHRLGEEREKQAAEQKREVHRLEDEGKKRAEDFEIERRRLEDELERLAADNRLEILRLAGEAEKLAEVRQRDMLQVKEELRLAREELVKAGQQYLAAAAETASAREALSLRESSAKELAPDDDAHRRAIGEALLRAILEKMLQAETITPDAQGMADIARAEIGMSDDDYARILTAARHGIYRAALKEAWDEGYITPEQAEKLAVLRRKIGVSPETHFMIEDELRNAKKSR